MVGLYGLVKFVYYVFGFVVFKYGDYLIVVWVDDGDFGLYFIVLEGNCVVSGVV